MDRPTKAWLCRFLGCNFDDGQKAEQDGRLFVRCARHGCAGESAGLLVGARPVPHLAGNVRQLQAVPLVVQDTFLKRCALEGMRQGAMHRRTVQAGRRLARAGLPAAAVLDQDDVDLLLGEFEQAH